MKEYISKEYICTVLSILLNNSKGAEHYGYSCIKNAIDSTPNSEIVYMYECSECGCATSEKYRYCPYCGKPMEIGL